MFNVVKCLAFELISKHQNNFNDVKFEKKSFLCVTE